MEAKRSSPTMDRISTNETPNANFGNSSIHSQSLTIGPENAKIVKRGILSKRGRNKLYHPWTLRTIIVDDRANLYYYDGKACKGEIDLKGAIIQIVKADAAEGHQFAFEISNITSKKALQSTSLVLASSSKAEADEWVDVLTALARVTTSTKINFAYESFDEISKTGGNQPTTVFDNIKKMKEARKQQQQRSSKDDNNGDNDEGDEDEDGEGGGEGGFDQFNDEDEDNTPVEDKGASSSPVPPTASMQTMQIIAKTADSSQPHEEDDDDEDDDEKEGTAMNTPLLSSSH